MANSIFALICVDVEPDSPFFGGRPHNDFGPQKWLGVEKGIPRFIKHRGSLERSLNCRIPVTWFFRSDAQIAENCGCAAYALTTNSSVVETLLHQGDEVAWHAHTWRWSGKKHAWYQEINDGQWIESCLELGFREYVQATGSLPFSFRAGWYFHCNKSMAVLDRLGIRVDLSAIPGIRNLGTRNTAGGALFAGFADWRPSPSYPFHPSKKDYRVEGKRNYELLEIPCTVVRKPLQMWISQMLPFTKFQGFRLGRPVFASKRPLLLSSEPLRFERDVGSIIKTLHLSQNFLVASFHVDELLSTILTENIFRNLKKLTKLLKGREGESRFVTAEEAHNAAVKKRFYIHGPMPKS